MTSSGVLWPVILGLVAILFAPTLLWVTTRLELLIASPEFDRGVPRRQKSTVRISRKES